MEETACCGGFLFIILLIIGIHVAILVWVAKDAKSRGMDNPVIWMIVVFISGVIGLIIYLLTRPSGDLVHCNNCANNKLSMLKRCPHCGAE